jgi:hypothetical protein
LRLGGMRRLFSLLSTPTRFVIFTVWLFLAWIVSQSVGSLVADFVSGKLHSLTGYAESDVTKIMSDYLFSLVAAAIIVIGVFLLGGHERPRGRAKLVAALNEVFNQTKQLFDAPVTTGEEFEAWKVSVNAHAKWIHDELHGKHHPSEINVLLTNSGGPRLHFRGRYGFEQMYYQNYLHYLEQRVGRLIEKYS